MIICTALTINIENLLGDQILETKGNEYSTVCPYFVTALFIGQLPLFECSNVKIKLSP